MSFWTTRLSVDDPMWYSLLYHITTLQEIFGSIPVLCTTSDWMEVVSLLFGKNHRKCKARKEQVQISLDTWSTKESVLVMWWQNSLWFKMQIDKSCLYQQGIDWCFCWVLLISVDWAHEHVYFKGREMCLGKVVNNAMYGIDRKSVFLTIIDYNFF